MSKLKLNNFVNGRNINELKQYNTIHQKNRTTEYHDSIVLNHFLRISHLLKKAEGNKSLYLHAGHLTILYTWWLWIPVEHRDKQWVSLTQLSDQIKKLLNLEISQFNLIKYLNRLVECSILERFKGPKGKNFYRYRPLDTEKPRYNTGFGLDKNYEPVHDWDF